MILKNGQVAYEAVPRADVLSDLRQMELAGFPLQGWIGWVEARRNQGVKNELSMISPSSSNVIGGGVAVLELRSTNFRRLGIYLPCK